MSLRSFSRSSREGFRPDKVRKKTGKWAASSLSSSKWSGMRPASTAAYSKNLSQSSEPSLMFNSWAHWRRMASSDGGERTSRSILLQLLGSCSYFRQNSRRPSRCFARSSLINVPNIRCGKIITTQAVRLLTEKLWPVKISRRDQFDFDFAAQRARGPAQRGNRQGWIGGIQ